MKKTIITIRIFLAGMLLISTAESGTAQFLKNLKSQVTETVKQTVQQRATDKASTATNSAIDKTTAKVGTAAAKVLKKDNPENSDNQNPSGVEETQTIDGTENNGNISVDNSATAGDATPINDNQALASNGSSSENTTPISDYQNYDFVPGDKIIFQPDLSNEPDAELPARFRLDEGNAEIQSLDGEKLLHITMGSHEIVSPMMSSDTYLPEQFTVEFDMMYENPDDNYFRYSNSFAIQFRDSGDHTYGNDPLFYLSIENASGAIWGKPGTPQVKFPGNVTKSLYTRNKWHHIAIYIHKNIGKVYIDQYRIAASNTMPVGADHLAIQGDAHYGFKIKNMRIAGGGDDKYNKVVTDGKFITYGIRFDVNKAHIKPESMGALNEIAKLMMDHSDLKFEIDGHTDSDGSDTDNMQLSQARADAVKSMLISLGINADRLTTKGFGESVPLDKNDTAEGKANNRRVEFVKM